MSSKLRGLTSQLSKVSSSLLPSRNALQLQQARTGFNSIPLQYGNPPDKNLPDDHDKFFFDGTAHPEPILDYHWYVNEERGRPLWYYLTGQALFFAFSLGVGYLGMKLLPGGFHVNGERPIMEYDPFGDLYLERGGDPHNIPAHVYRHVKAELPAGHAVNILKDPVKLNDVTFLSYNKEELPEGYKKTFIGHFPVLNSLPYSLGFSKPPALRTMENWYPHPEHKGVPIVGGLPLEYTEEDIAPPSA